MLDIGISFTFDENDLVKVDDIVSLDVELEALARLNLIEKRVTLFGQAIGCHPETCEGRA